MKVLEFAEPKIMPNLKNTLRKGTALNTIGTKKTLTPSRKCLETIKNQIISQKIKYFIGNL
jgi:hypothetical protein